MIVYYDFYINSFIIIFESNNYNFLYNYFFFNNLNLNDGNFNDCCISWSFKFINFFLKDFFIQNNFFFYEQIYNLDLIIFNFIV